MVSNLNSIQKEQIFALVHTSNCWNIAVSSVTVATAESARFVVFGRLNGCTLASITWCLKNYFRAFKSKCVFALPSQLVKSKIGGNVFDYIKSNRFKLLVSEISIKWPFQRKFPFAKHIDMNCCTSKFYEPQFHHWLIKWMRQ